MNPAPASSGPATKLEQFRERSAHLVRQMQRLQKCVERLESVASAGRWIMHGVANAHRTRQQLLCTPRTRAPLPPLTPRMRQVLELLAAGKSERQIASELHVSPRTIHIHVTRLHTRLAVHSRAELLALAYRCGVVRAD